MENLGLEALGAGRDLLFLFVLEMRLCASLGMNPMSHSGCSPVVSDTRAARSPQQNNLCKRLGDCSALQEGRQRSFWNFLFPTGARVLYEGRLLIPPKDFSTLCSCLQPSSCSFLCPFSWCVVTVHRQFGTLLLVAMPTRPLWRPFLSIELLHYM